LSSLVNGKFPVHKDEQGYIFVDRNGTNFGILLDYLRNGILLIPPTVSMKMIVLEAQFYSIGLDEAFLGELKDGVYGDLHSGQRTSLIYIERCKEEPWRFGFTGILMCEDNGKKVSTIELWREVGSIVDGRISLRNFFISYEAGDLKFVQVDRMNRPFVLKAISSNEKNAKELTDGWWVGDKFVDGLVGNYVHLAIANLEIDKWVCHIRCDQHKTMAVQQFEFLTDHFFIVKGAFGLGFWIFYHREAERLLTFNPYYAKDLEGQYIWFSRGWMRFMKNKNEQLH